MLEDVAMLNALNEALAEIEGGRLKISVEEYKAKIAKRAWIMNWQEALDVGAVDGIVSPNSLPTVY